MNSSSASIEKKIKKKKKKSHLNEKHLKQITLELGCLIKRAFFPLKYGQ